MKHVIFSHPGSQGSVARPSLTVTAIMLSFEQRQDSAEMTVTSVNLTQGRWLDQCRGTKWASTVGFI